MEDYGNTIINAHSIAESTPPYGNYNL